MSTPMSLTISPHDCQIMLSHCVARLPEEACGLLGGLLSAEGVLVQSVVPIVNALHSPVRFRMNPEEQLHAFLQFEADGQELVAIFHSHPTGPEHPSPTDLAEFAYPGVLSIILSPRRPGIPMVEPSSWSVRVFQIEGEPLAWQEVTLQNCDPSQPGTA